MRKIHMVVFALLVIFSMTMSAEALESKTIYRQDGMMASAEWIKETPVGNAYHYLGVMKTDDGTDIYLSICTSDIAGTYSCKSGYKFINEDVFSMDKKLDSAALSGVQVDLYDWYNPAVETVTIQAQWTGTGDVIKGSYKSVSKYGDYISKYSDSSSMREAAATGSINGMELGSSAYGSMVEFKYASMWTEK